MSLIATICVYNHKTCYCTPVSWAYMVMAGMMILHVLKNALHLVFVCVCAHLVKSGGNPQYPYSVILAASLVWSYDCCGVPALYSPEFTCQSMLWCIFLGFPVLANAIRLCPADICSYVFFCVFIQKISDCRRPKLHPFHVFPFTKGLLKRIFWPWLNHIGISSFKRVTKSDILLEEIVTGKATA